VEENPIRPAITTSIELSRRSGARLCKLQQKTQYQGRQTFERTSCSLEWTRMIRTKECIINIRNGVNLQRQPLILRRQWLQGFDIPLPLMHPSLQPCRQDMVYRDIWNRDILLEALFKVAFTIHNTQPLRPWHTPIRLNTKSLRLVNRSSTTTSRLCRPQSRRNRIKCSASLGTPALCRRRHNTLSHKPLNHNTSTLVRVNNFQHLETLVILDITALPPLLIQHNMHNLATVQTIKNRGRCYHPATLATTACQGLDKIASEAFPKSMKRTRHTKQRQGKSLHWYEMGSSVRRIATYYTSPTTSSAMPND